MDQVAQEDKEFFIMLDSIPKFKDVKSYMDYTTKYNFKRVVIFGSGRGEVNGREAYARLAYQDRDKQYYLVNISDVSIPDLKYDGDTSKLSQLLPPGEFDRVIFENINVRKMFTKTAIHNALDLLRQGGELVSSDFSRPVYYNPSMFEKIKSKQKFQVWRGGGLFDGDAAILISDELVSIDTFMVVPAGDEVVKYLNEHLDEVGSYLEIEKNQIKFVNVKLSDKPEFWPRYVPEETMKYQSLMIITKE